MEFLNPIVFLVMLVPVAILLYLLTQNISTISHIFTNELREKLYIEQKSLTPTIRNTLFFIALTLFIVALARPVSDKQTIKIQNHGLNLAIAIDISKSMLATDIYPNRLLFAKEKIKELALELKGHKIALIVYASNSFMVSPLSSDTYSVLFMLDKINSSFVSQGGTNILSALNAGNQALKDKENKYLILFSDGGDSSDLTQEIDFIKDNHLKVFTMNIGSKKGAPIKVDGEFIKDEQGKIVIVKRDDNINTLAKSSNGLSFTIDINSNMKNIASKIVATLKSEKFDESEIVKYNEFFIYPLILGAIFLLLAFSSIPKNDIVFKKI